MKKLIINRLRPRFIKLVNDYMVRYGINQTQLAKQLGLNRTPVNKLLKGAKDRPLTAYYISMFHRGGVFTVDEIYDGAAKDPKEKDFWERCREAENWELLRVVKELRKHGIDATEKLKSLYKEILNP